ncbi:MAG: S8 family serine peptidase, partial [Blastocatellia bacterium]
MKPILIAFAIFAMLYATVPNGGPQHPVLSDGAVKKGLDSTQHPTLIFLNRGIIDTSSSRLLDTSAMDAKIGGSAERPAGQSSAVLRIVQFNGAIKPAWVSLVKATGCSIVGYLPNYSYIVFGGSDQIAALAGLERKMSSDAANSEDTDRPLVRWMAAFQPLWKIDRAYSNEELENSTGLTTVQIEMINGRGLATAEAKIASSGAVVSGERGFAGFTVVTATVPVTELIAVANIDEVLYIERAPAPALLDERSDQIAAGNLTTDLTEPIGPGYLSWLTSLGLDTPMDFAIEFSDSGLDRGSTSASFLHPDFLDASGHSRVGYINNYVASEGLSANDTRGHGTLVTSIAAGYPNVGINDPDGYQLGTGAAPFATIGASRIFDMMGTVPPLLSLSKVMSAAYADGARVANESWGQAGNQYDIAGQEFDELTRDSRPDQDGNQEMTFVFAAGNEGPGGHVDSPGTAKNVITVGASENYRPDSFDTCNLDGQGALGPDASDNALG